MNECQRLHETIVRDIFDVINSVKDYDEIEWINKRYSTGSIARRASNLTLVFPVIASTSLSIGTAAIICKAIERKCCSLLQILFSAIQISDAESMFDYLKQFHTNLDLRSGVTLDDFMDAVDRIGSMDEGAIKITDRDVFEAVREDMRNINFYLDNSYNEKSINDYRVKKNIYGESYASILERATRDGARSPRGIDKSYMDYFKDQLTQSEINKANEVMPTTMVVNFISMQDGTKIHTSGIIGVKAKLYPVSGMEIVTRISSKYTDSNTLFNLVRASTREISFFRDLAFAVDKAKFDAINMARESNNARIFKVLERRAAKNKFSTLLKKNDASPITSLVITQDEVEYLKKYNNMDMDKSHITRTILDKFNLMDIVIVDETLETAKFLFDDGDSVFEVLPFDALEKAAKDSSYKKVINLMNKINH